MTIDLRRAGTLVALVLCAVAVTAQTPTPTQPQPPEVTTGLILGRAIDAGTGKPIPGAFVTLSTPSAPPGFSPPGTPTPLSRFPMRVVADSGGRFVFHDLPKGLFSLSASKPGYNPTAFGRSNATDLNSQLLPLTEGERRGDVTLKFWKYASLSGRVVDEAGEPIIGITIKILRRVTSGGRVLFTQSGNTPTTDDRGIYRIATLVPGDYIVVLVNTQTTVPVSLQEQMASASGAQDLQRQLDRSSSLLSSFGSGGSGQRVGAMTLSASDRSIAGPVRGGRVFVYPTTYYPTATSAAKATVITLGSGDERTAVDFHLRPVATAAISGTLVGANGPESFTVLTLTPAGDTGLQRDFDVATAEATTDGTGAFTFLGITPGAYVIRTLKMPPRPVSTSSGFTTVIQTGSSTIYSGGGGGPVAPPPIPEGPTLWAAMPVTVAEVDVTGVIVSLNSGARVSGRVEFEGSAEKPTADRLVLASVQVDSADGRSSTLQSFTLGRGVVDATGQFRTLQQPPGRYVVRANAAFPGWSFKSATLGGRDVSDAPLEIGRDDISNVVVTFTDQPTEISGTARDNKGPDPTATVLVFPAQSALWLDHGASPRRFKTIRVGSDGAYRVTNIPAGDYLLVALRTGVPSDWPNPALLQKLTAIATHITITDGEKKSVDVETKEVR